MEALERGDGENAGPCDEGSGGEGEEEETEEEDLAAEPRALPHFEGPPGIGRATKMEDGYVESDGGDAEEQGEEQRRCCVAEEGDGEGSGDGLHEGGHEDEGEMRVLRADTSGVDAL